MRAIGKKPFLLGTLAALLILALCAMPLLAGSPVYAGDKTSSGKASTAGSKDSSADSKAPQGKSVETIVELDSGVLCIPGSGHCFSATISPTSLTSGTDSFDDVLFTLTYTNCSNSNDIHSERLGYFETEIPDCFTDIAIQSTTAYKQYDANLVQWVTAWVPAEDEIQSKVKDDDWNTNAIYGNSDPNKAGRVIVTFTADAPECVGYLDLEPDGGTVCAGNPFDIEVTARECDGDKWDDYGGTVHFSSSDGVPYPATLPADYTFDNHGSHQDWGEKEFNCGATLYTAGTQTITVEDCATYCLDFEFESKGKSETWRSSGGYWRSPDWDQQEGCEPKVTVCAPLCSDTEEFTVQPGCATRIDLTPNGGVTDPGVPFDVTVTLYDDWDNVATNYDGTVSFGSSDGLANLPGPYPFVPATDMGTHLFLNGVTLYTPGFQTVMATGTAYDFPCCPNCGGCGGTCGYGYCKEPPTCECDPPTPDEEIWEVTTPPGQPEEPVVPAEEPVVPPEEEVPGPLYEGAVPGMPVLVVNVQGTTVKYPVTQDGRLLVDALTTSPDGLVALLIPKGCPVLNADGTPAYLNADPDVFSIVAADLTAPAGATILAAYRLEPTGINFSCDASIIVKYDPNKMPAGTTPVMASYNAATGQWTDMEMAGYVAGGVEVPNTLQGHISSTLEFAVIAQ